MYIGFYIHKMNINENRDVTIHIHMHACRHVRMYVCMYVCMYVSMYVCILESSILFTKALTLLLCNKTIPEL